MVAFSKLALPTVFIVGAYAQNATNTTTPNLVPDVLLANGLTTIASLKSSNPNWSSKNLTLFAPTNAAVTAAYGATPVGNVAAPQGFSEYDVVIDTAATSSNYYVLSAANPPIVWYNVSGTIYARWGTGQSIAAPFLADNGIVYALNSVVDKPQNISTMLAANAGAGTNSGLSTQSFLSALSAAGMTGSSATGSLDLLGSTTVFAPSDAAMAKYANFFSTLTVDQIRYVLQYHVVPTNVQYSTSLKSSNFFPSLAGGSVITATANNVTVHVNNATIVLADCFHSNGVVHVINEVLIPNNIPGMTTATPTASAKTSPTAAAGSTTALLGSSSGVGKVAVSAFGLVSALLLAVLVL
ncbi:hypothetical protein SmJEL517_g05303 [Synchytrium microbalum]|uniref:FAS1 domain-containing protein n=1 Tax=Synchytrium microbalum TaxID=1806994 RepID=A0A507BVW1_9FUNG|nr:uncharacterized protein SmJEL517_g05303 [Synchytrium microbalum]TPX31338.1 hypothetical protein SmJEL517_g05303 [Synchytrium microbalum]